MNWLANASKTDAKIITRVWPNLKLGKPVPKELKGLVGIYGNYPVNERRDAKGGE